MNRRTRNLHTASSKASPDLITDDDTEEETMAITVPLCSPPTENCVAVESSSLSLDHQLQQEQRQQQQQIRLQRHAADPRLGETNAQQERHTAVSLQSVEGKTLSHGDATCDNANVAGVLQHRPDYNGNGLSVTMCGNQNLLHSANEAMKNCIQFNLETAVAATQPDSPKSNCATPVHFGGTLSSRLTPIFRILQLCGFFPGSLDGITEPRAPTSCRRTACCLLWRIPSALYFALNLYTFTFTIKVTAEYAEYFGFMHAFSVTSVITGMKPLINSITFLLYNLLHGRHVRMIRMLNQVDSDFVAYFQYRQNIALMNWVAIISIFTVGLLILMLRTAEMIIREEEFGNSWLGDLSIVLVPAISIWGTLPLLYFVYLQRLVLMWCVHLRKSIARSKKQPVNERYTLAFYYRVFCNITYLQGCLSDIYGPWILFSLGWTVFTLCLSIYFVTHAHSFFELPAIMYQLAESEEDVQSARLALYFNIIWGIVQVITAVLTILIICNIGIQVNEASRRISAAVLSVASDMEATEKNANLVVLSFMYRVQQQTMWGVTVWRAFTIERSAFFTMFSLILTYFVVLMRFRTSETDKTLQGGGPKPELGDPGNDAPDATTEQSTKELDDQDQLLVAGAFNMINMTVLSHA